MRATEPKHEPRSLTPRLLLFSSTRLPPAMSDSLISKCHKTVSELHTSFCLVWQLLRALDIAVLKNSHSSKLQPGMVKPKPCGCYFPPSLWISPAFLEKAAAVTWAPLLLSRQSGQPVWQQNSIPPLTQQWGPRDPYLSGSEPWQWCLSPSPLQVPLIFSFPPLLIVNSLCLIQGWKYD